MTPAPKHSKIEVMTAKDKIIHHIPAGHDFASTLVRGFMARVSSPEDMTDSLLLLPNRRLAQSVQMTFLRYSEGKALVLPRMLPIGDIEEDAIELAEAGWDSGDLPPVIAPLERQLHLARQLHRVSPDIAMADALALARALAEFLDSAQANGCDFSCLADLADGDHAAHWQKILTLLDLLGQWWPEQLKVLGKSDPVIWRDAAIHARAEVWQKSPPRGVVVIAGSTGSVAATRDLMKAVIGLERGHVVLPGIDTAMINEDWQALDATDDPTAICHPQYQLFRLLTELGLDRDMLRPWSDIDDTETETPRLSMLREAMRPAGQTGRWQTIPDRDAISATSLEGFRRIDCHDGREEAEVIALAMREILETPKKTAALVTADRVLAKNVSATLARWDITVADSAGTKLVDTSAGQFIRLIADAWTDGFRPIKLLGLLQHRLATAGMSRSQFRKLVRKLDRRLMRGRTPYDTLSSLVTLAKKEGQKDLMVMLVDHLLPAFAPLEDLGLSHRISLADLANMLGEVAENLAATPENPIAMWQGQDGMRVARFLEQLAGHGKEVFLSAAECPAVLTVLLSGEVIYPDRVGHPRLAILGLVEARMQHADLIILGGMNEGTAPPRTPPDPWMSNAMRESFGLPPANWRVGLSAHDAFMVMSAKDVLITRAMRVDGAPTEISRWLRRIEAVVGVARLTWPQETRYRQLARLTKEVKGNVTPVAPPAPRLQVKSRPRDYSATGLDTLLRDPYAIYAQKVLRLYALDGLEESPSAADRGTAVHAALRDLIKDYPSGRLPETALDKLIAYGESAFADFSTDPWVRAFWWPRFETLAHRFIAEENLRRGEISTSFAEVEGEMEIEGLTGPFTLRARADRIDLLSSGGIRVIDYKTGRIPSKAAVTESRALQLRVEAVLAAQGGFGEIDAEQQITTLEYWKVGGRETAPMEPVNVTPDTSRGYAAGDVTPLINLFNKYDHDEAEWRSEITDHPLNRYSDYHHLARVDEWRVQMQGDDE
jgi:ATP-dependent helicase/nuclease subunit B